MAHTFVNLLVNDNGFNAALKRAIGTFASLGNAANSAKGQFAKFADGVAKVAQSQELLNAALKGNPYGLMAQAATFAFTKIVEKATEATDAEMRAMEWTQKKAEIEQQANEAIGRSTGELMAKYELLRVQWLNLSSDQQKIDWIKNNQSAFNGLNLAVNDVSSAENVFVKNTSQVVAALKTRAEAEAYAELYKEQIKKNAMNKASGKYNVPLITDPYYKPTKMEAKLAGFTLANKHENFEYKMVDNADPRNPGQHRVWTGRLSQIGLNRLNENRQKLGSASLENADRMLADQYASKMAELQFKANELQNNSLFGRGGSGSGNRGGSSSKKKGLSLSAIAFNPTVDNSMKYDPSQHAVASGLRPEDILGPGKEWDDYKDTVTGAIGSIGESMNNLSFDNFQESYEKVGKDVENLNKTVMQSKMAFGLAANAVSTLGGALAGMEDPGAKAVGTVLQALSSIALGFAMASVQAAALGPIGWIAWVAAGIAAFATAISTVHQLTGLAEGGIVGGNQYSGDNIYGGGAMVNSGELVLNKAQQGNLASQLSGNGMQGIKVAGKIKGTDIILSVDRTLQLQGKQLLTWG